MDGNTKYQPKDADEARALEIIRREPRNYEEQLIADAYVRAETAKVLAVKKFPSWIDDEGWEGVDIPRFFGSIELMGPRGTTWRM